MLNTIEQINSRFNESIEAIEIDSDPTAPSPEEADAIVRREHLEKRQEEYARLRQTYRIEKPMTIRELLEADFRDDYLIDGCLVANQAAVTAGPSKSCKTTIEVARSLALVTGEPFLGKFEVARRCKVFFATAESGKATVQRTFRGMAGAMRIDLNQIDPNWLKINWWVPRINNIELLDYFTFEAEQSGADVAIIDPLYQCLDDQQASYVLNGQQLATLSNRLLSLGITPILLDHAKRSSANAKEYEPLELEDISGAGKAEFFRQWMLISRRSRFMPNDLGEPNLHDLWLTFGGSAGHASVWALDLSEQNASHQSREYSVEIRSRCEAVEESGQKRQEAAATRAEQKAKRDEERLKRKADELVSRVFAGDRTLALNHNDIELRLGGILRSEVKKVIALAVDDGKIKQVAGVIQRSNGQKYAGYMLSDALGVISEKESKWVS